VKAARGGAEAALGGSARPSASSRSGESMSSV